MPSSRVQVNTIDEVRQALIEIEAGVLDSRYFTESEHIDISSGASDAGKPVKLDSSGLIAQGMWPGRLATKTVTEDYTITSADEVILVDTAAALPITITLPGAAAEKGKRFSIKKIGIDDTTIVTIKAVT